MIELKNFPPNPKPKKGTSKKLIEIMGATLFFMLFLGVLVAAKNLDLLRRLLDGQGTTHHYEGSVAFDPDARLVSDPIHERYIIYSGSDTIFFDCTARRDSLEELKNTSSKEE